MRPFRKTIKIVRSTLGRARRHNIPRLSAALAFYALLSLAPIIVITVSLAGLVLSSEEVEAYVEEEVRSLIGKPAAAIARNIMTSARRPADNIIAFGAGFVFLLFGASRVFAQLNDAMQVIWETDRGGLKGTVRNRLVGSGMVLAAGLVFWVGILVQAALTSARTVVGERWSELEILVVAADWLLAFGFSVVLFVILFRFLPRTRVPLGSALAGAVVTTVLILFGRFLFGLYLRFGMGSSLQGAAGSLLVVVVWTYYIAQILFLGAEFTRAHSEQCRSGD
jgi:membrane protein